MVLFMKTIYGYILLFAVLMHFGSISAAAQSAQIGNLPKQSTLTFGAPLEIKPLSTQGLRLFVWNIHKATDPKFPKDFENISYGADLTLLQEAISSAPFTTALSAANPILGWTLAKSFAIEFDNYTGVATGSHTKALREEALVSTVTEPFVGTPKTILLSEYALEDRADTLLVANIHGINFVTTETYKVQIQQLISKIQTHKGPLIVAGDFNTWNIGRMAYLTKAFRLLDLSRVDVPDSGDLFLLDHIFTRGLKTRFVFNLNHIDSSDHKPLMVDFLFP